MDDFAAHERIVRDAPAIRICLMSLLAFAFHRSDYLMVAEIEEVLEKPFKETDVKAARDQGLEQALRGNVEEAELVWWLSMAQHAQSDVRCHAVFHRLARQRLSCTS